MEVSSSNVHFKRQDCLRRIFRQARKGTCLFTRLEQKYKQRVKTLIEDISKFIYKSDTRFGRLYTKCSGEETFEVFWEIDLGSENPSMYLHRGGVTVATVSLQAESQQIWQNETTPIGKTNYLNAHAVNVLLHMKLSKALKCYSRSNTWKQRMEELKLDSIGLEEVCMLHFFFGNELNMKRKEIRVKIIPTIKIHDYCKSYAHQWFGDKITHFIAQPKHSCTSFHPSLQWTSSYHEHEHVTMTTFPTKITTHSFYGALLMVTSDATLKVLSRDIVLHVYMETIQHVARWLEMSFGGGEIFKESDHDAMMENFFQNLRQQLECHFIPNHFNPEINLLEIHGLDFNRTVLIINKLKSILRGNCECCRGLLKKNLHQFQESGVKKKKKKVNP